MNKKFLKSLASVLMLAVLGFSSIAIAKSSQPKKLATLKYKPEFILKAILEHKGLEYRPEVAIPVVIVSSKADLKTFQDDVEPQWGMRPTIVTNVFVAAKNKIYLHDDKMYYDKTGRCIDDSLAHELTHYIQVKYRGWDLNDDSLEWDAIDMQSWFREKFCSKTP